MVSFSSLNKFIISALQSLSAKAQHLGLLEAQQWKDSTNVPEPKLKEDSVANKRGKV